MNNISLKDVISLHQWQEIQDHFADVIGVSIRTVAPDGTSITAPSRESRLCSEILQSTPLAVARCKKCLPNFDPNIVLGNKSWKEGYECCAGLHNFSIPVMFPNNKIAGYAVIGPVLLGERQKPSRYKESVEKMGIDFGAFIDALIEIKVFSFTGIQSVLELIDEVMLYLAELGYHRYMLERVIPLPGLSKLAYRFSSEKLLNALLDVSTDVTKAEVGSIMIPDEKTGDLHIKISRGLDRKIVKSSSVRLGEGLSGLAAKEKRVLLLNDALKDEKIKNRLKRPELKASIVAPIQIEDELLGVMNLATRTSSNKFTSSNVETLRQLIKLVSTTFQEVAAQ